MMTANEPVTTPQALWRGFRGKCPNCGKGRLFHRYLKVFHHCEKCNEAFHHQKADDFPAYLVMFFVGHVVVSLALVVEFAFAPSYWIHLLLWLPLTLLLALGLLQPIKGGVIALQWQIGLHGFQASKILREQDAHFASTPIMENISYDSATEKK